MADVEENVRTLMELTGKKVVFPALFLQESLQDPPFDRIFIWRLKWEMIQ